MFGATVVCSVKKNRDLVLTKPSKIRASELHVTRNRHTGVLGSLLARPISYAAAIFRSDILPLAAHKLGPISCEAASQV